MTHPERKLKVLLVDDEFLALNLLEEYLRHLPDMEIVDKVKSPIKALEIIQQETIDLLFLDIQMPSLSGNNLLRTLKHPPATIFTTAYSEYALEAFELNAIDYLLKPFSFERFLQAVNKARDWIAKEMPPQNMPLASQPGTASFSFKADGKIIKLHFSDILFVEGLKEYVRIVCKKEKYVTLESLKNLEEILPATDFIRVHKSYIVAQQHVSALDGNLLELAGYKIPISRNRREEVIQHIFG
ncbi:MAG TPA: LytTR family DNA-binding domain-containing protein [Saprospiraceae bacterium]|nr:LytTR family DNA-binding domain-containing protein [Saprospiraceae bacterium]HMQ84958.1 LytTR family DNA-binding domain-containing protein [Saprospiraceae bacterium]